MSEHEVFARRLFEIEGAGLAMEQGRWSLEAYRDELLSEDAEIFLWPNNENFSGFVLFRIIPFDEVWIVNWASENKGRGEGRLLFGAFVEHCRNLGIKKLGLEVRASNAAAIKIYQRAGLALIGRRENYYSNGEAALVFSAPLS